MSSLDESVYRGGMSSLDRICLQGEDVITRQNLFTGGMSSLDRVCLHGQCVITIQNQFKGGMSSLDRISLKGNVFTRQTLFTGEECHH
jgi:predicted acyltransferase (DUF342 family)